MTTLAHISDLHFGAELPEVVEGLSAALLALEPELLVVSGDLTQRARGREFAAARRFLDRFPGEKLIVPGNHDIPLFDVFTRFLRPLARYRRHIGPSVDPFIATGDVAVLGINTARSNTWKDGRVSRQQIDLIRQRLKTAPDTAVKIVVTHHPFLPPPGDASPPLVGRAAEALEAAEESGVDLMLAGHLHHGYTGDIRTHHSHVKRPILVAQAGTATSHRIRNEPNGFNVISVSSERLTFSPRTWNGSRFEAQRETRYWKSAAGWQADPSR